MSATAVANEYPGLEKRSQSFFDLAYSDLTSGHQSFIRGLVMQDAAKDLLEAAHLAANVLFLLGPEVERLGLNAKNVPTKLGEAIAKAEGRTL